MRIKKLICWLIGHKFKGFEIMRDLEGNIIQGYPDKFYCSRCMRIRKVTDEWN